MSIQLDSIQIIVLTIKNYVVFSFLSQRNFFIFHSIKSHFVKRKTKQNKKEVTFVALLPSIEKYNYESDCNLHACSFSTVEGSTAAICS
jgi:hypothetical protein